MNGGGRGVQLTSCDTSDEKSEADFAAADHVCKGREDSHCTPREWNDLVEALRPMPLREKIEAANAAMNRHP